MMVEDKEKIIIRKILVAVDTSSHSQAALEAAAMLAKINKANINGIFVHERLWSCANHFSGCSAINVLTGKSESSETDNMQRQVDQLAARLRRQLKRISRRHDINHTWNTGHGRVSDQILEASKEADLITIGRRGRSLTHKNSLGSTARRVVEKATKPVLILKKGLHLGQTITVVYNGTKESQKGLKMALNIAKGNGGTLSVLVTGKGNRSQGERNKTAEQLVDSSDVPAQIHFLHLTRSDQFINTIHKQHSGLLVTPKQQRFLRGPALDRTLRHIHCPVLLVV